jgi:hypothetical protein
VFGLGATAGICAALVVAALAVPAGEHSGAPEGARLDAPVDTTHVYLPLMASTRMYSPTRVTTTTINIPTHLYDTALTPVYASAFNMNYTRLDRGRYDPGVIVSRSYTLIVLENDFIQLSLMPALGGRIYQVVDKTSGNRLFYQNPVIKPSPWGPSEMGWWLAVGGMEWCLPVEEHGYEWGVPWLYSIAQLPAGIRVTLRDSDASDRVRARVAVTLFDGEAAFRVAPTIENPSSQPVDMKFWLNAMLAPGTSNAPGAELRFVMDANAVTVHSSGDDRVAAAGDGMSWPLYNGVDWSRLGNWRQWFGFFQRPVAAGNFQAVYDEAADAGVVRTYDGSLARGAKYFAFGWSQAIPPSNYTDDNSAYVEIHGGAAPTFADSYHLGAGASLAWEELWYPVAQMGGLTWANAQVALHIQPNGGTMRLDVATSRFVSDARVLLLRRADNVTLFDQRVPQLGPSHGFHATAIGTAGLTGDDIAVVVMEGDAVLGAYQYIGPLPTPGATSIPAASATPQGGWTGRVTGMKPSATGIVRVRVRNQAGLTVTLRSADGTWQAANFVGTKPEYGPDALEFAPIPPGDYGVTPSGLGATVNFALPESTLAEILFER